MILEWVERVLFRILRIFRRVPLNKLLRLGASYRSFADYFKEFETSQTVRGIFGDKTEQVLRDLLIELTWFGGYMFINSSNGHLVINARYLSSGDRIDIYLDLIHELVHVRQFLEGRELFDNRYSYVERPTEIEAYQYTVKEARRIGLSDERICEYLKTEWMSKTDLQRLAKTIGVNCE